MNVMCSAIEIFVWKNRNREKPTPQFFLQKKLTETEPEITEP